MFEEQEIVTTWIGGRMSWSEKAAKGNNLSEGAFSVCSRKAKETEWKNKWEEVVLTMRIVSNGTNICYCQ